MRRRLGMARLVAALLLVVPLAGCWPQLGGSAGNTHFNGSETKLTVDNVASLSLVWSSGRVFESFSRPVVWGGTAYMVRAFQSGSVPLDEVTVNATDPATGEVLWRRVLMAPGDPAAFTRGVVYIDDALWVPYTVTGMPACTSTLERLDPKTGAVLSADPTAEILSPIVGAGPVVAHIGRDGCGTETRTLVVRDAKTRAVLWTHTFPGVDFIGQPTMGDGKVFVIAGSDLYAFGAEGCGASTCEPLWVRSAAPGFFGGRPEVAGGQVLVEHAVEVAPSTYDETVQSFATADGKPTWQTTTGAVSGFAVGYDKVYVNEPVPGASRVAVYPLRGCGAETCAPLWTVPLASGVTGTPTVGGGVVYTPAGSRGQDVVALAAHGCGAAACGELVRVTLPGAGLFPADEYTLAAGHLIGRGVPHHIYAFAPM